MTRPPVRVLQHNIVTFRHVWRSYLASVFGPLLFLVAVGVGVGRLVDRNGGVDGQPYLEFLAPGLLVGAAMQTGALAGFGPIMGRIRWDPIYESMLSSPLVVGDVLRGELLWIVLRLIAGSAVVTAAIGLLGAFSSAWALLGLPVAVLTGAAFAVVFAAVAGAAPNGYTYDVLFRVVIIPLFVFGGVFYPVDRLPAAARVIVELTPLPHGTALARDLQHGPPTGGAALLHLAVIVAWTAAGWYAARRTFRTRLAR